MRVLPVDMLHGGADPARIVRLVRDGDVAVLAVQEFTPQGEAALAVAGIGDLLPYRHLSPEPEAGGSGLYSRHPMLAVSSRRNAGGFQQASATIQPAGAPAVQVVSVHPLAPAGPDMLAGWAADLRDQPPAGGDGPLRILLGDFNATLDHAELRRLIGTGYRDAADAGLVPSRPARDGFSGLVTIDHVLADERIGVRAAEVHTVTDSDHRAVLATLTLPAAG
ncbi:endonuclease/exonuclease/phosphatase family protein [Actinoplanes utahensis]|uniref:endonuclease/exonuclease/phosphatase family protein n=1 Tax=Actinoplanes utahensis TaxID=1869 RepID=UPI001F3290E7|nr:endonuclease/exonuclease/phosphatase family protein [Actinoplanes utahensis]